MITVKDYVEAIDYKITGGSEYQWRTFGDNARYLDSCDSEGAGASYSIVGVFDSISQRVYVVEAWDYIKDRVYRWVDPEYVKQYKKDHKKHDIDYKEASDTKEYIDLDVEEDILDKVRAIVAGEEYDERVKVPVDFSDEDLLQYMKLAHEMDITFNELCERALKAAIDDFESNPTEFKEKAERFLNENYSGVGSPS